MQLGHIRVFHGNAFRQCSRVCLKMNCAVLGSPNVAYPNLGLFQKMEDHPQMVKNVQVEAEGPIGPVGPEENDEMFENSEF